MLLCDAGMDPRYFSTKTSLNTVTEGAQAKIHDYYKLSRIKLPAA